MVQTRGHGFLSLVPRKSKRCWLKEGHGCGGLRLGEKKGGKGIGAVGLRLASASAGSHLLAKDGLVDVYPLNPTSTPKVV